jgi:glycosyltransferase involved in cell wall biosynthesis
MPEFTVVVPCHDRADLAIQVVSRLVGLGCPTIAVDDGSTPPIEFPPHPLLQVIPIAASGAAAARNRGAAAATTEWLVFTDSDTLWSAGTLASLEAVVARTPRRTWAVGVTRIPDGEKSVMANWMRRLAARDRPAEGRAVDLATGLFACRRSEFHEVGGFLALVPGSGGEDWELGQRARRQGYAVVLAPGWEAENRDAPFTFRRLLARERNYQLQVRRLRAGGVAGADDWLVLDDSRLRDRALLVLAKPVTVSLLDKVGALPDPLGLGSVLHPVYRAAVSGYLRSTLP